MNIILLSGGSGTRLWPLSNEVRSKQFLKILRNDDGVPESMVQRMYRMIKSVSAESNVVIATSESQIPSIKNQLGTDVEISIEPSRRDTFPAISLSVLYLRDVLKVSENESVVVCPVDPLVGKDYFCTLDKMYRIAGKRNLTLMGIKPTYPSAKYGYIICKDNKTIFIEKPNELDAQKYIDEGAFWNGGVFAFKISYITSLIKKLYGLTTYEQLLANYDSLEKTSFDYAVAEKEDSIAIVEYDGDWKDLGTWNTFTEAMTEYTSKNCILGENSENTHIVNELSIPIIGLGLKDMIVAASPDGILVSDKHSSSYLKKYVPNNRPMFEKRAWGEYKILDYKSFTAQQKYLVKELVILPKKCLSYQKHNKRSEIWSVVHGTGIIVINDIETPISTGDTFCIKPGDMHSVKAINELHIIEVQIGSELVEEDIERFEYDWKE